MASDEFPGVWICHGFVSEPVFGFTSLPLDAAYFLF